MNRHSHPFDRACACACAVLPIFLGACSTGTVILLPGQDGHRTAVAVKQGDHEVVLDRAYAAATQTPFGPWPYKSTPQEVEADFGAALAAQPMRPATFSLNFIEGKDELTDDSRQIVESVFSEISKHPVPDVVVIGHTDTVGSDQSNDALSLQRAEAVRTELIRRGVAADSVVAGGRGKRELLVPTADGVAEPRNRRVQIIVR